METLTIATELNLIAANEKPDTELQLLRELAEAELLCVGGGAGEVILG
jgi:hypothetical protein